MITRELNKNIKLEDAFFPVVEESIHYGEFMGHSQKIPGYKAIVDKSSGNVLSVVSSKYRLLRNREAFELAGYIVQAVFEGKTLSDFECYNIMMPKSKCSCRIDLIIPNNFNKLFGDEKESWIPFVRISNSYNRTMILKYEIGFCRWICKNGIIFGQFGITFSMNHLGRITQKDINQHIEKARKNVGEIGLLWSRFEKKMCQLKETLIPLSSALAMYCKAFDIKVKKDEESEIKLDILRDKTKQIVKVSKEYFRDLGNNAYAMMNVLTDFASFPEWTTSPQNFVDGYQRKVGLWVDDLLAESMKKDFSLSKYLGEEYQNTAYYLESLVPQE